jgi:hypothetical protein
MGATADNGATWSEKLVSPLPFPAADANEAEVTEAESVRLFLDRALAVRPELELTPRSGSFGKMAIATPGKRCTAAPVAPPAYSSQEARRVSAPRRYRSASVSTTLAIITGQRHPRSSDAGVRRGASLAMASP